MNQISETNGVNDGKLSGDAQSADRLIQANSVNTSDPEVQAKLQRLEIENIALRSQISNLGGIDNGIKNN